MQEIWTFDFGFVKVFELLHVTITFLMFFVLPIYFCHPRSNSTITWGRRRLIKRLSFLLCDYMHTYITTWGKWRLIWRNEAMLMDGNFPLFVFIIIVFFHCKLLLIVSIVASSKDLKKNMYTYVHPQLQLIHQQLLQ
jgi:hypothetical protein